MTRIIVFSCINVRRESTVSWVRTAPCTEWSHFQPLLEACYGFRVFQGPGASERHTNEAFFSFIIYISKAFLSV